MTPAGLDRNEDTGEAAVAAVGGARTMWHREGVELLEADIRNIPPALRKAGLDFRVEKREVYHLPPGRSDKNPFAYKKAAGCYVVVRRDRNEPLGQVGETYTPLQNRDAFGVLQPLLDAGLCTIETAGALYGGRDVWMLVRFDEEKMLGRLEEDEDDDTALAAEDLLGEVRPYGLVTNNHAGQRKVTLKETPVRVVCANTLGASLSRQRDLTVEVVHASDVKERVQTAANLLFGKVAERYGTVAEVRRALRDTKLSKKAHQRLVLDPVVPVKHLEEKIARGEGDGRTRHALEQAGKRRREIKVLWTEGEDHAGDHSAWEAYNGLVQALDHSPYWETRSGSSRVKSELNGKLGQAKGRVARRLLRFREAGKDERQEMLKA